MANQPDDNSELDPKCGASPFNNPSIRSWCFSRIEVSEALLTPATIGSGPFEERAFDMFLHRNKITPCQIDEDTDLLVIGREDWHCFSFRMFLIKRQGNMPRIYSQEMYLTYWATGCDPLEAPEDVIDAFVEGHPALEYLGQCQEQWVSTTVYEESSGNLEGDWPTIGLLKYMGYEVGMKGAPERTRREILRKVFIAEDLPSVNSQEYMSEWGEAESTQRLMKIANSIATFCRNNKRWSKPSKKSIAEWESDLAWLRKEIYGGGFEWPGTEE